MCIRDSINAEYGERTKASRMANWEARCAKLEGVIVLLLREVKDLKSRVTNRQSRGDRRLEALEQQLLREMGTRFTADRVERQAVHDSLVLRIGAVEEAREKQAAQDAIDRKQLELMFKTEMLSSYSDMEEHIESELGGFRAHLESRDIVTQLATRLAENRQSVPETVETRVADLEQQVGEQRNQVADLRDELVASKVSVVTKVDDRMLSLTREVQTETAMVQQSLEASIRSYVAAQKASELEAQQKLWELEKAMGKIELSGQQVVDFSEEYMQAMHAAHQEQQDQTRTLETLLLQRREEMGHALEMLTRNVSQAEAQVTLCWLAHWA
eukprot:TRINITY_DN2393_c0_g2_i2.p1 TRINITY_DN2393_c0_g2~~TRINITY_DN2393_c0_g2_i2.p1  ORF type:complete len:328 (+),score=110.15 TRINITY_DN2393_c0_g2_i2:91-1074(+)